VRLVGSHCNGDGVGAVVEVQLAATGDERRATLVRAVALAGGGYASGGERRLHLGLGENARVEAVSVRWPCGREESFADQPVRSDWLLREGSGRRIAGR
jgi:hypothetical protein